jgi:hypothetical protein
MEENSISTLPEERPVENESVTVRDEVTVPTGGQPP